MTSLRPSRPQLMAAMFAVVAMVSWTAAEVTAAFLSPGYSLFQVVWMRYGTHILAMLLLVVPRSGWAPFHTKRLGLQLARGALMIVMPASFILSFGHARLDATLALFWLAAPAIVVLERWLHRERVNGLVWAAAIGAALGAEMILRPNRHVLDALVYGIPMGASFSLYVVWTRTLRTEHRAANLLYTAVAVFVPMTFVVPFLWHPLTVRDGGLMLVIGLAGLCFIWALDRACELVSPSSFAAIFPLQLVLASLVVPFFAGDRPGRLALAGTALILGGAVTGIVGSRR